MKEFFVAALPWICMGVSLAVALNQLNKERSAIEHGIGEEKTEAEFRTRGLVKGICIGECLGIMVSSLMKVSIAYGIGLGMLGGVLFGKLINGRKHT